MGKPQVEDTMYIVRSEKGIHAWNIVDKDFNVLFQGDYLQCYNFKYVEF